MKGYRSGFKDCLQQSKCDKCVVGKQTVQFQMYILPKKTASVSYLEFSKQRRIQIQFQQETALFIG